MEQGRLSEAVEAYQNMADLKPDLHAYTRAAHVRWLKGDLSGAIEMMQLAVQGASPRDADTAAWVYSRMAMYQLQAGDLDQAAKHCAAALDFQPEYPPALLVRGRLLMAQGKNDEAAAALGRAATLNPVPEYQWASVEALRLAGRDGQIEESLLKRHGATTDPRTFALYLATCGEEPSTAVRLAKAELNTRADVFTHDAVAWALAAAGRWEEAGREMQPALAEGTRDARLFLHAGIIASELARPDDAKKWLREAAAARQMLLPSEQAKLSQYAAKENLPPQISVPEEANLKTERNKNNQIQKGRS
jgi:tetratricopeptide (TPR) repeat protein